ncbi:alpha/beta hydrolase [Roseomonas sp. NAR14]|uniref:Alpha/beta hydrolase n=1 Tax=Roseomonas acroporae TaxID=2937791 RepID=A0A9X2BZ70_9PROT|nr:alpha/beta hydrolase [Roseomonas acroporae]MCK8787724.1 alpha/beta hydrolase [Roseomonas acroporae]
MSVLVTHDGEELHYRDWGEGPVVVLSHGWPLNADMWEYQISYLSAHGFRCIAFDRRGFGRSSQPWSGHEFDTFADDLAMLLRTLDLVEVTAIGFCLGASEILRYLGRHGADRLARVALLGAVLPGPDSSRAVLAALHAGLAVNRPHCIRGYERLCYGLDRPGAALGPGMRDWLFQLAMQASPPATRDSIGSLLDTDFGADLAACTIPTLVIHGDDDQIMPVAAMASVVAGDMPRARLLRYPGAPHGLWLTHREQVNADLHAFLASPP